VYSFEEADDCNSFPIILNVFSAFIILNTFIKREIFIGAVIQNGCSQRNTLTKFHANQSQSAFEKRFKILPANLMKALLIIII